MGKSARSQVHGLRRTGRRLLILQSNEWLLRAFQRYFALHFDRVFTAANPDEASEYLSDSAAGITDLISGQEFGYAWPLGSELIAGWRNTCPTLKHVVLVTARDDVPDDVPGVDAVRRMPIEPAALCPLLAVRLGGLGETPGVTR